MIFRKLAVIPAGETATIQQEDNQHWETRGVFCALSRLIYTLLQYLCLYRFKLTVNRLVTLR